jgi:fused signal recognition particle receptor
MVFWRRKNNSAQQDQDDRDNKLLHPASAPALESEASDEPVIDPHLKSGEVAEHESDVLDQIDEIPYPSHQSDIVAEPSDDQGGGWLSQLSRGLNKSTSRLTQNLNEIFVHEKPDAEILSELEDVLISADLGPKVAQKLVAALKSQKFDPSHKARFVRESLATEIAKILEPCAAPLEVARDGDNPRVYLICGVNGVGKTTTIGKLAYQLHFKRGKKLMIAAGDTFRAAAIEQLGVWAQRTNSPLIARDLGADAAAVAFEAYEKAAVNDTDILMIDTAGRLHNKSNLMAELEKIVRVLKKKDDTLPHEVILVLDATTGQNALAQVEAFHSMVRLTGLVVTKLDGSAKGGVVVALADKFALPIYAVGVGEDIADLQAFRPQEFAKALVGLV